MVRPVTVVMTVYFPDDDTGRARLKSAQRTLISWAEHLRYPNLYLHVADDSPTGDAAARSQKIDELVAPWSARVEEIPEWSRTVSYSHQPHQGVGASMNRGFKRGFDLSPCILYAVDDWALVQPLDLTPWVALLDRDESLGMLRLGPPHPDMTGTVKHIPEGWMLLLDRHHYFFATRPALFHERMLKAYGPFKERADAYEVEYDYLQRCQSKANGPAIAYALPVPWEHVGTVEVSRVQPT